LQGLTLDPLELAILGRDAEHWYGTKGGIMDQFVISHAHAERAVLLDCRSLAHEDVPLPEGVTVVIANTGTKHNQIASPFAQRRQEAEMGLQVLRARLPGLQTLRDVTPAVLDRGRDDLFAADRSGVLWRRCHHVVHENARVVAAAAALRQGDLPGMGVLMAESHASLRDDYEVSCAELDAMVTAATAQPGCVGARMTGGGFGGCTVNLVTSDAVVDFCARVSERYERVTGIRPAIFAIRPSEGIQTLELE
jgi:galactokinase